MYKRTLGWLKSTWDLTFNDSPVGPIFEMSTLMSNRTRLEAQGKASLQPLICAFKTKGNSIQMPWTIFYDILPCWFWKQTLPWKAELSALKTLREEKIWMNWLVTAFLSNNTNATVLQQEALFPVMPSKHVLLPFTFQCTDPGALTGQHGRTWPRRNILQY